MLCKSQRHVGTFDFPGLTVITLSVLVAILATDATASAASVVGDWDFDEGAGSTAFDSSVNGLHGTLNGNVSWVPGVSGTALMFDASQDFVEVPHSSVLDLASAFSVSFWINGPEVQTAPSGLFSVLDKSHGFGNGPTGWTGQGANASGGNIPFVVGDGSSFPSVDAVGALDGEWHHVAFTATTSPTLTLSAYVDAVLVGHGSFASTTIGLNSGPLTFGINSQDHGREFTGLLDELSIYDGVLSQSEINTLAGVPEPASLLLSALGGAVCLRRRR